MAASIFSVSLFFFASLVVGIARLKFDDKNKWEQVIIW